VYHIHGKKASGEPDCPGLLQMLFCRLRTLLANER